MHGRELQKLAESAGVGTQDICNESGIRSRDTVLKVFRDQRVRQTNRSKVERAVQRLAAKAQVIK